MATTYTSTITLRCWKEHTCACCGAVYAYDFQRKVSGTGGTEEKATVNARANVAKTLERETDMHPCPTCGLYQPDMIAQRRNRAHWRLFWVTIIAFAIILILRAANVVPAHTATWIAVIAGLLASIIHLALDLKNPNTNLALNRDMSAGAVSRGQMLHQPGQYVPGSEVELARPAKSLGQKMATVLLLAAAGAIALPELLRAINSWPANADCWPPVVGPGDTTRVYMRSPITSIKGLWRGSALVSAQDVQDASRRISLRAKTNQNDWGTTIRAKSSEKSSSTTPWVEITVPDDPKLAGRTMQCDILLRIVYPVAHGGNFDETPTEKRQQMMLQLASPGAGERYNEAWWFWTPVGMLLVPGCAILLAGAAKAFGRRANPTRVYPMENAEPSV